MSDAVEIVKPPYSASAEVDSLAERMREIQIGDRITWDEITEAIGEPSRGPRGRNIVGRARERLVRVDRIVFRSISGIGFERVNDAAKVDLAHKGVKSVRRKAIKNLQTLNAVEEIEKLEKLNRDQYFLTKTILGMVKQASGTSFGNTLQKRLSNSSENLESVNLLRLFGKSPKNRNESE